VGEKYFFSFSHCHSERSEESVSHPYYKARPSGLPLHNVKNDLHNSKNNSKLNGANQLRIVSLQKILAANINRQISAPRIDCHARLFVFPFLTR